MPGLGSCGGGSGSGDLVCSLNDRSGFLVYCGDGVVPCGEVVMAIVFFDQFLLLFFFFNSSFVFFLLFRLFYTNIGVLPKLVAIHVAISCETGE